MPKKLDALDQILGSPGDTIVNTDTNMVIRPDGKDVVLAEKPLTNSEAEALAFMEEPVTFTLYEASDPNEPPVVQVGCNGEFRVIQRGVPTTLKRKFVNCLIAKNTRISTPEVQLSNGDRAFAIRQTSALAFPFSIDEDTPKGREWFKRRFAEAY